MEQPDTSFLLLGSCLVSLPRQEVFMNAEMNTKLLEEKMVFEVFLYVASRMDLIPITHLPPRLNGLVQLVRHLVNPITI